MNSMDGVSDRDYLIEYLSALSMIMMHLSRFSEEVIIWNSNEYKFVEIDDAYSTGSSIMPQMVLALPRSATCVVLQAATGQPRAIKRYSDFTLATVGDLNDLPMIMGVLA